MPVGRMVVALEMTTVEFQRAIKDADASIARFGKQSENASKGLNMARGAIQTLAFQAAGVEGPIGKLGAALLQFGVGGAFTVAFLAGFVAMRKAMEFWERDATERAERVGALNFDARAGARTPFEDITQKVASARTNLRDARAGLKGAGTVADAQETLNFYLEQQNEMLRENAKLWAGIRATLANIRADAAVLASSGFSVTAPGLWGHGGTGIPAGMVQAGRGLLADTAGLSVPRTRSDMRITLTDITNSFANAGVPLGSTSRFRGLSKDEAIGGGISTLMGLLSGGGAGALFSGGFGLAGTAIGGPIGGAIGGQLGSLLGGLFGGGPSREELMIEELKKINQNLRDQIAIEQDRKRIQDPTSINIIASEGVNVADLEVLLRRRDRMGGKSRVPKNVSLAA